MENPDKSHHLRRQNKTVNPVWDADSSLYDSFELKSFQNSLKSAIASRTLSMPHLSERQPPPPPQPQRHHPTPTQPSSKKSKLSKQFQKLVRTLFGSRQKYRNGDENRFYMVLDKSSGALSTIPEVHETGIECNNGSGGGGGGFSVMDRSVSERFGPGSIGMVPCA